MARTAERAKPTLFFCLSFTRYQHISRPLPRPHIDAGVPSATMLTEGCTSAGPWAPYRGWHAAVLVEVVEHLDPEPLAALGPAVFGRLRPPLVVITTPDAGYNEVMATAGVRLLHNGLRNRDHRFEWCVRRTRSLCSVLSKLGSTSHHRC